MITQLSIRAFKGLREFSIAPRRVNLLIGANGTGKTNFTDLIAFIASLCPRGLPAAVEDFGGLYQVRTRQPGAGTPYKLRIDLTLGPDQSRGIQNVYYHFALAQSKAVKIQTERLDAVVYKRKAGRPLGRGFPLFDLRLKCFLPRTPLLWWTKYSAWKPCVRRKRRQHALLRSANQESRLLSQRRVQ